jgi:hypothetical protein
MPDSLTVWKRRLVTENRMDDYAKELLCAGSLAHIIFVLINGVVFKGTSLVVIVIVDCLID